MAVDVRIGPGTSLRLGVDGYVSDVKDMIIWAPDSRFVWSPRNFGVKRRGFDVESHISFADAGLDLRASYAYARATFDRPGDDDADQQIIYRPRHTGALAARWRPGG